MLMNCIVTDSHVGLSNNINVYPFDWYTCYCSDFRLDLVKIWTYKTVMKPQYMVSSWLVD